jgi:hypothetical protein
MALIVRCHSCQMGNHDDHVRIVSPPPEGGVGGAICDCPGQCRETAPEPSPWIATLIAMVTPIQKAARSKL